MASALGYEECREQLNYLEEGANFRKKLDHLKNYSAPQEAYQVYAEILKQEWLESQIWAAMNLLNRFAHNRAPRDVYLILDHRLKETRPFNWEDFEYSSRTQLKFIEKKWKVL